jgi:hypothetical protein
LSGPVLGDIPAPFSFDLYLITSITPFYPISIFEGDAIQKHIVVDLRGIDDLDCLTAFIGDLVLSDEERGTIAFLGILEGDINT